MKGRGRRTDGDGGVTHHAGTIVSTLARIAAPNARITLSDFVFPLDTHSFKSSLK